MGAVRFGDRLELIASDYYGRMVAAVTFRLAARINRGGRNPMAEVIDLYSDAVDGAHSAASKCYRLVASKPERFKEVRPGNDDGV